MIDPVFTDCVRVLERRHRAVLPARSGRQPGRDQRPVGDYTTDDIPELKPLAELHPQGPETRRRPALPVNSPLEAR